MHHGDLRRDGVVAAICRVMVSALLQLGRRPIHGGERAVDLLSGSTRCIHAVAADLVRPDSTKRGLAPSAAPVPFLSSSLVAKAAVGGI